MKKTLLALAAVAAMTGSASAADLAARPYAKAPMPAPVANWTGFYVFGGGGGGIWDADTYSQVAATGATLSLHQNQGGDGWFGTVGAGYDWQFSGTWVAGVFADGQFGSLRGNVQDPFNAVTGKLKMETAWAAGVRVGYLIAPNVLSYVNGGYSGSHWSGSTLLGSFTGLPTGFHTDSFNRHGWFVGGGVENNLNIFGIQSPGWFMKTEYRAAYYDRKSIDALSDVGNVPAATNLSFKPWVQTISTSLVYRFNWTGPVVAKY
ncbi:outer membrane immunogenic protein [Bradyrhizobium yuanmingense]|uniref:outer membrane protein n=1 Tax=Bradyrhizobium yuanmingense TaxID=108015 RepID=UPI003518BBAF